MGFHFEILAKDGDGLHQTLLIDIGDPVCDARNYRWECVAQWSGMRAGQVKIYGVTSFQALRLTLDILEINLPAMLRDLSLSESGLPWPTPRIP